MNVRAGGSQPSEDKNHLKKDRGQSESNGAVEMHWRPL
jgi:hypothetical protein